MDQIATDADLPSKGEEMIVFGYESYLYQHHTYTQKTAGYLPYSSESMEINEFEQIIKDMRDEKKKKVYVYSETRDYMTAEYIDLFESMNAELVKGTEEDLERFITTQSKCIQRLM
jgi:hypothetical protein